MPEAELNVALEKLVDADLLFVDGVAPDSTYRFKHALIQEAAYESMLRSRRREIHAQIAEALVACNRRSSKRRRKRSRRIWRVPAMRREPRNTGKKPGGSRRGIRPTGRRSALTKTPCSHMSKQDRAFVESIEPSPRCISRPASTIQSQAPRGGRRGRRSKRRSGHHDRDRDAAMSCAQPVRG